MDGSSSNSRVSFHRFDVKADVGGFVLSVSQHCCFTLSGWQRLSCGDYLEAKRKCDHNCCVPYRVRQLCEVHSDTTLCQPFMTTTFAKRAFRCSAPAVWNWLPKTVLSSDFVAVFQSRLKHSSLTRLFLLPLLTNTLPGPSVSEVTTLWRYTNVFIIIIVVIMLTWYRPTWVVPDKRPLNGCCCCCCCCYYADSVSRSWVCV